jgi:hypothetical protein
MDSSKLLEIRTNAANRIILRSVPVDSSLRTFAKVAATGAAVTTAAPIPQTTDTTMRTVECVATAAVDTGVIIREYITEIPVIQQMVGPMLPCTCLDGGRQRYIVVDRCK